MNGDRPITDYTNRDYASLLASLLDQAALKLPEWTDRSENDLGRLMLESFAYVGDVLLYYQDRIANEAFLATAVERRSVIDLLSLIGYTLATPAPASADLTLVLPNDSAELVQVQVGAVFATQDLPDKRVLEFIYWPEDNTPLEITRDGSGGDRVYPDPNARPTEPPLPVINATRVQNEVLGVSSGEANQHFRLKQRPVLLQRNTDARAYLSVEVNGAPWQRRDTLLYSPGEGEDSNHYTVHINENDEAELIFGDGIYGRIPAFGSTLRATYLIGGGAGGNVGSDQIRVAKSGIVTPSGEKVTVTRVNNRQAAAGGADRESIENARRQAPGVFRSRQRAVTQDDIVALAENVAGVARALAVPTAWNYLDLYVVAAGNFEPPSELLNTLKQYFEDKRMATMFIEPRSPVFTWIHATVEVGVASTFYREDVRQRVEAALADLFRIERLNFGQTFYLSKIYEAAEAVPGTDFANVTRFQGNESATPPVEGAINSQIQLRSRNFPRPGDLSVSVTGGLD